MRKWIVGSSLQARSIELFAFGKNLFCDGLPDKMGPSDKPWVLFIGAVHGDEVEGVWALENAVSKWEKSFPYRNVNLAVVPRMNPDGVHLNQRWNARGVDLNRNLPTKDWTSVVAKPRYNPGPQPLSEPENIILLDLIRKLSPIAILSVHSFENFQVNVNGPAHVWGRALAEICKYPVTEDIGYPTPGSLGTFAGKEMKIPTITLEIERGISKEKVLELHAPVIEGAVQYWDQLQ